MEQSCHPKVQGIISKTLITKLNQNRATQYCQLTEVSLLLYQSSAEMFNHDNSMTESKNGEQLK